MRALTWRGETTIGEDYTVEEIPADMLEAAEEAHRELVELVADHDDELAEAYLGEDAVTPDAAAGGDPSRRAVRPSSPPSCAAARSRTRACSPCSTRSSPTCRPRWTCRPSTGSSPATSRSVIERHPDTNDPFSALAFKIAADPHLGRLTYIRLYSGKLEAGSTVLNSTKGRKERIGKIYQMHANKREEIASVGAGQIVAVMGLKDTTTGETLSDQANPVQLESMDFPAPVIEQAIEPKTKSDQEKLGTAIQRLAEEDPTFRVHTDDETGQTIIAGMGELHLEVLIDRMKREFRVEANIGKPQVAYRETLRRPVEKVEYTHKKQSGGSGQYARVIISLEPQEAGSGYEFVNAVTGGRIPREYIPAVDEGIQDAMQFGVLAGYPVEDIKVTLTDGAYHDVDSSELAFKIAGSMVFKEAARRADPALLEPVMAVEVTTPEDYLGTVIGDLNARRGQIQSMNDCTATRSSRPWCRCRRCSATSATCGRRPRARRRTRWSSTPTPRPRSPSPTRSSRRPAASDRGVPQDPCGRHRLT